ncbi:hypothetical protein [Ktedonobacter sp. SOSP1-85]|uniref:hypothetical protein n=1 Tax=Ktedonobacter sp. SOSP1-85 TaxID=2778367 RepID=UPI0019165619|nr:hypothetical protein [Ktedonobacter sp. SOSP1-85]
MSQKTHPPQSIICLKQQITVLICAGNGRLHLFKGKAERMLWRSCGVLLEYTRNITLRLLTPKQHRTLQCKVSITPVQKQNLHLSMSFRQELKELSGFGQEVSHNK